MFGGAGSPAASSGTTAPDLASILNMFGGAGSPAATPAATAASPSRTTAASTLANMASAVRSMPAGGLLTSLSSGTPGNFLSTLLQGGNQAATTTTTSGAATPTQRAGLLTQLHESLGTMDKLFDFPQVQDLLSASGFNLTELLDDDHPLLDKLWAIEKDAESELCSEDHAIPGVTIPTHCSAGSVTVAMSGGFCTIHPNQTVVCKQPRVTLVKTPPVCAFAHTTPEVIVGKVCKVVKEYGNVTHGLLGHRELRVNTYDITNGWDSVPGVLNQAKGNAKSSLQTFKNEVHSMASQLQNEYQQGKNSTKSIFTRVRERMLERIAAKRQHS
ncbi:hypothetical protein N2152v2_010862 [Parachlorella kessleri]